MSDIFREVDEEVRRDKANELWKKHGAKFIAAAVLFVAGVAGWQFWQAQQFKERAAAGGAFELAIAEANGDKPEAQASLTALSAGKSGTYPALARFRLASELARTAKDDAGRANAVSAFDAMAADSPCRPNGANSRNSVRVCCWLIPRRSPRLKSASSR